MEEMQAIGGVIKELKILHHIAGVAQLQIFQRIYETSAELYGINQVSAKFNK